MRAIVQRVMKASVTVGDELVSSIGQGLCVLIGISRNDTPKDMEYIVRKLLNLRVFDDEQERRWSKSVTDMNYEILCVSQFTLYSVLKGNKPDFHCSMGGEQSKLFYEQFLEQMKSNYKPELIKDGEFGAYMQVNIQNDGPVTITLESPQQEVKPDKRGGNKEQKKVDKTKKKSDQRQDKNLESEGDTSVSETLQSSAQTVQSGDMATNDPVAQLTEQVHNL